jgi:hypothetical protein
MDDIRPRDIFHVGYLNKNISVCDYTFAPNWPHIKRAKLLKADLGSFIRLIKNRTHVIQ